jgi:tetratricopeptide (TPR) repeat protein
MLALRLARVLGFALLLCGGAAHAAEPDPEARRLYAQGKAEYAQGHYVEAIQLFERSYALSESTALLFNMAQAHRLAGPAHCADALALYKSYVAAEPQAENRKEVDERIAELGQCSVQHSAEEQPVAVDPAKGGAPAVLPRREPPSRPSSAVSSTGPVLVAGTGAALLVAGGVLFARAWDKHREAEERCPCYPGTYATWEVLTNVSYALLAVGGATLAGGVTWWVVGQPAKDGQPAQALLGFSGKF